MWIWLLVAALAAIGELLSYDLFLAPVAAAAIATAVVAPFAFISLQLGVFAGLSLLGITFLRPILRQALGVQNLPRDTGALVASTMVGRRGIVTQAVSSGGGQIRIGEAEFWTARPFDPAHTLALGDAVEVLLIEGIAALVESVPGEVPASTIGSKSPIKKGIES